jgi:metal-responsive CopG/Arc/MetJ family transcriptional regulator
MGEDEKQKRRVVVEITEELAARLDYAIRRGGYSHQSDFMRDAIREKLERVEGSAA